MKQLLQPNLVVKKSVIHGYGVFAAKDFSKNEIIEECYTILTAGEDSTLAYYYFGAEGKSAILTGCGLIYNHSDQPNATHYYDELHKVTVFKALRPIAKDEEIFHSYGATWFGCRSLRIKKIPIWYKILRYTLGKPLRCAVVLGALFLCSEWLKLVN